MTGNQVLCPPEKESRFSYKHVIVLSGFFSLLVLFGAQYSYGVFFKPLIAEFGWTRAATAGAYSLNMIFFGVCGVIAGRISDRVGPRAVATVSGIFAGSGYLLMSHVDAIWQTYLFYGLFIGMGTGGIWIPLLSTVARWFSKSRGLASGIVVSGVGIGTIIMPPVANQLISAYNWRTSFVIVGIVVLVVTLIATQFLRRSPDHSSLLPADFTAVKSETVNLQALGLTLREAVRTWQFWTICAVAFCAGFCQQTVLLHVVPYATDTGISAVAAASILSVIGGVSIAGRIGLGSSGDRIGFKRTFVIIFSLYLSWSLLAQLTNELWKFYLFAVVFALGYGGFIASFSPLVAEFFGVRAHGAIYGLAVFILQLGCATGPLTAGRIFDISGKYYWAFVLCAILGTTGLILSMVLKPVRK